MRGRPTKEQFLAKLESMMNALKNDMINQIYKPGEYLPSEKALAQQYQLSNNSVRKALEELVHEGWIEKIPNVGNRVLSQKKRVKLRIGCNESSIRNMDLYALLQKFEQKYPWISVDIHFYSHANGHEGDRVDLFTLSPMQFQQIVERKRLGTFAALKPREGLYSFLNEIYSAEGELYLQPIIFSPVILCYNTSHFQNAGLSIPHGGWSWEDLIHHATMLTKVNGTAGFSFHLPDINRWPLFLLQSGDTFQWDGEKIRDIRGSRLLEAIRLSKEVIQNREAYSVYLSESNEEIEAMFLTGKVSMILSSYMALNEWKDAELEFDISPVPFIQEPRTLVLATGVAMHKNCQHPEAAQHLIDYLCSPEAQLHISNNTLSIPSDQGIRMDRNEARMSNVPGRYMLYHEMIFSYRVHDDLNVPTHLLKPLYDLIKAYWADLIDEEEMCDRISQSLM